MFTFILLGTVFLQCFLLLAAERPKYRLDYRYEKAFDNFYKLHTSATTWAEARVRCQAEGTELLVPSSLDEADAVPLLVTPILNKFQGIFVGIHDLYSERSFVTIKGREIKNSIYNMLWEYKQPLHREGRCVAMRRTGRIFVHPCEKPLPFICKISGSSIEFYKECNTYDKRWILGPNGTCYFMHVEPQTWYQAYGTCLSAGGHLAILNSQEEADHLKTMYKNHEPRRMPKDNFVFLGYSDLLQRHHYRTLQGELVIDLGYKEWEISCPEPSEATSTQRCGGMRRHGLLAVGECDTPSMFFCEKPANNSVATNILRMGKSTNKKKHKHGPKHAEYHEISMY